MGKANKSLKDNNRKRERVGTYYITVSTGSRNQGTKLISVAQHMDRLMRNFRPIFN